MRRGGATTIRRGFDVELLSEDQVLELALGPIVASMAPGDPCPDCGELLTEHRARPEPGTVALCLCGALLVITDSYGLRLMTEEDRQRLERQNPQELRDIEKLARDFRWLAGLDAELDEQSGPQ
jgi:hypothetical protein